MEKMFIYARVLSFLRIVIFLLSLASAIHIPFAYAAPLLSGKTVVIDPGEGGADPGGIVGDIDEKTINLATSLDVGAILSQDGAHVVYTRSTDTTVSLEARAALANSVHADAFVAIHANTINDPSISGVMTFYGQPSGYVGGVTRSPILVQQSESLATDVQDGVQKLTGEVDRGVHKADFYVLGYTDMPSILIETGFMTNPAELQKLLTPSYQGLIAEGIALGIEKFLTNTDVVIQAQPELSDATYVSDVTYPDHTTVSPGQTITKTWQVTNSGSTAWTNSFSLTLQPGATIQAPPTVPLPPATPGQTIDVSVPVTIPSVPGTYTGTWRFTDPNGQAFGDPVWIIVTVPNTSFTPFWVETTQQTSLWSTPNATSTLMPLAQWTYLHVTAPQQQNVLPVTEPITQKQGYVLATAVGPSGPPPDHYVLPSLQPPFQPFWVETTQATPLYSGPHDPSDRFSILPQWSYLLVLLPQSGPRLYVRNPATGGTAYVDASAVGPSGPPPSSPAPAANTSGSSSATAYTVKPGDTIWKIAQAFGVPPAAIVQVNGLTNPNDIVAGQVLQIPSSSSSTFQPFWVENYRIATLWSGINAAAIKFGIVPQFTPMLVLAPAQDNRYLVRVSTTNGLAYIATDAVGPSGPPPTNRSPIVPAPSSTVSPSQPPLSSSQHPPSTTYTVQAGDSLWTISQQFGITIDALAKANNLNPPYSLIPGQTLHIPTTSTSNRPLSAPSLTSSTTYTIQPGDTLSAIAQHFNIALALLAQANGLSNPNDIVAGQVLQIPQTTPATVSVNSGSPSTSSA